MAGQWVVWDNLKRTLDDPEVVLLLPLKEALDRLRDPVRRAQGPMAYLRGVGDLDQPEAYGLRVFPMPRDLNNLEILSNLILQADDLLDQILTFDQQTRLYRGRRGGNGREHPNHLVRRVVHAMARSSQEVRLFLSSSSQLVFTKKMARRVDKISKTIEYMVRQLPNEPDFINQVDEREFQYIWWPGTAEQSVIGRENDKEKIVNMLLRPPIDSMSKVSVLYMSGLAGVGKSALVKDIYEDQKVTSHFDLRMWIPVSQITDESEIIREIVESYTTRRSNYSVNSQSLQYQNSRIGQNDMYPFRDLLGCRRSSVPIISPYKNTRQNDIDIYEQRLRKEIKGKLYLLVLDDVCLQKWQRLRRLLDEGAEGSQILVTTRLPELEDHESSETPGVKTYTLPGLKEEHSWTLFRTLALYPFEPYGPGMRNIGLEIVDICKHVPLTIKFAARFLYGRNRQGSNQAEWLRFRDELRLIRDQQSDVLEYVLYVTCLDLPTHLRACFGYCSLFPNDFTFNKQDLISLWIAQGFVSPLDSQIIEEGVISPQDSQSVDEGITRPQYDQSDEEGVVIPHDDEGEEEDSADEHDGQSLEEIGEMYFMELLRRCLFEEVSYDELGNILSCKMQHIVCSMASKLTVGVDNMHMTDSCTIHAPDPRSKHVSVNCQGYSSFKFPSPLLKYPSIRTLIFFKEPDCDIKVDRLVCSQLISSYRRLRVLDLHDLGIKELPDSIGDQIHLRYLDLSMNDGLVTLPKSFTRLHNLQTLKLNSCSKLKRLATDFGLLNNLRRFEIDDCDSLTCMPLGLEKLTQLETLSRFVVSKGSYKWTADAGLRALSELKLLRGRLTIEFTGDCLSNLKANLAVLAGVRMKSKLNELKIRWAQRTSDVEVLSENEELAQEIILNHFQPNSNLKILRIEGYKGEHFPRWANVDEIYSSLPHLVIISIEGCGKCEVLPPFGILKRLRKLTLRNMTNVRYFRSLTEEGERFVNDPWHFNCLQELTLHNFFALKGWQREVHPLELAENPSLPCLSKLMIWNCPNLISLPSFPQVTYLKLWNVNQLLLDDCARKASSIRNRIKIRSLQIKTCSNLKGFEIVRDGLGGLSDLKHLVIEGCNALSSLASDLKHLTSLERLKISSCKELDLSYDTVQFCRLFSSSPWKNLKFLRELILIEIPKMTTLPEGIKHVTTLKLLWISACQSLRSLPEWISYLTALQHLRIESCRALKRLPEGLKFVRSLMKVEITECPELMERCREHKGEDWPYIEHARVFSMSHGGMVTSHPTDSIFLA